MMLNYPMLYKVILKFPGVVEFVNFIATIRHSIENIDKPSFTLTGQFSEKEIEAANRGFNAEVSPAYLQPENLHKTDPFKF